MNMPMSNPARAPRERISDQLKEAFIPDATLPSGFPEAARRLTDLEVAKVALQGLDMMPAPSVFVDVKYCIDESLRLRAAKAPGGLLLRAQPGIVEPRPRSFEGKRLAGLAFAKLPDRWRGLAEARSKTLCYARGGTAASLGRVARAYPRLDPPGPLVPISASEARAALRGSGLWWRDDIPSAAYLPYPLAPKEGGEGLVVNPHADNGSPVLGKWNTPGAAQRVVELAGWLVEQLNSRAEFVDKVRVVRELEATNPGLMVCMGKTKADYYKLDKISEARLRFYNVLPRQVVLVMQQATQVLEGNAQTCETPGVRTAVGMTLTHGGAARLVAALERDLAHQGWAFVHVGDDSWVVLRDGEDIVMFALDCSNFDLTQRNEVTFEVHRALATQLSRIDLNAAAVWYAYARERLVLVHNSMVMRWRHAGVSGMPLQSKVNDMLMDVLISRAVGRIHDRSETGINAVLAQVGAELGFDVRVEQYTRVRAPNLVAALAVEAFLFIGYYFYAWEGNVACFTDVPRTLAQMQTPTTTWEKGAERFVLLEAMRLGSIALNLGVPPPDLVGAFEAFRQGALSLLDRALQVTPDVTDERLRWAVHIGPFGAEEPSLRGLRMAVARDPGLLWLEPRLPRAGPALSSWADQVEEEEDAEAREGGYGIRRPIGMSFRRIHIVRPHAPMRPATVRNLGRPPPIAWWAPDRPKFLRLEGARGRTGRGRRPDESYSDFEASEAYSSEYDEWDDGDYWEAESSRGSW